MHVRDNVADEKDSHDEGHHADDEYGWVGFRLVRHWRVAILVLFEAVTTECPLRWFADDDACGREPRACRGWVLTEGPRVASSPVVSVYVVRKVLPWGQEPAICLACTDNEAGTWLSRVARQPIREGSRVREPISEDE